MTKRALAIAACLAFVPLRAGQAAQLRIVAAENVYGDVARQLAGPSAHVVSILNNPNQDPHLFEASPSTARALAGADLVVLNGADYDPWMAKLLRAAGVSRPPIVVADLMHVPPGANPHLWYDPATMPAFARALASALAKADPAHAAAYDDRLRGFLASLAPLDARIARLRAKYAGAPVTATEPVFGDMARALGLTMRNEKFQLAVMNNTEPGASEVAAFETDLRRRRVRLLIYNRQVSDAMAERLLRIAKQSGVPTVGVTETEPPGTTYQSWMGEELDAIGSALAAPRS